MACRVLTLPFRTARWALTLLLASALAPSLALATPPHDRVIVVMMENKSYRSEERRVGKECA